MNFFEAAGTYAALKAQIDAIRRSDPELEAKLEAARIRTATTPAPNYGALAWKIAQGLEDWSAEADALIIQSAALGWLWPLPRRLRELAADAAAPRAVFLRSAADDAGGLDSVTTRPVGLDWLPDEPRR